MNRVLFLVDGFNLYHSLADAQRDARGACTKWLDLKRLCSSYLQVAGRVLGERASLERIDYFSAIPTHRSQAKQGRHALYLRCLRGMGVHVELARFKGKHVYCPRCGAFFVSHEEKETDVAIGARLFEVCQSDEADTVVLMSGDTDLAPALRTCKRLYPHKVMFFAFPYKRRNVELAALAPESFAIKLRSVVRHQLPDPLILPDGTTISKPSNW